MAIVRCLGVLLVAVATWMRAAAGPGGLREVFRRMLEKLRWIPSVREAVTALAGLDPGPRLIAAGRAGLLSGARLLHTARRTVRRGGSPTRDETARRPQ